MHVSQRLWECDRNRSLRRHPHTGTGIVVVCGRRTLWAAHALLWVVVGLRLRLCVEVLEENSVPVMCVVVVVVVEEVAGVAGVVGVERNTVSQCARERWMGSQ